MKMENKIKNMIHGSVDIQTGLNKQVNEIISCVDMMCDTLENGGKILIVGNGGSAADAQHIAGELVGRFKLERKGLSAIALTTDTSILTAWSNDYDFSTVFERQVEALAKDGDVLFGLSTSGNSENVVKAFEKGKEIGTKNISLTGNEGGRIKPISDLNINIYSDNTPRIQEGHVLAYHIICELVEEKMFGGKD